MGNRRVPHLAKTSAGTVLAYSWGILTEVLFIKYFYTAVGREYSVVVRSEDFSA